jgi:hypothetical protein
MRESFQPVNARFASLQSLTGFRAVRSILATISLLYGYLGSAGGAGYQAMQYGERKRPEFRSIVRWPKLRSLTLSVLNRSSIKIDHRVRDTRALTQPAGVRETETLFVPLNFHL